MHYVYTNLNTITKDETCNVYELMKIRKNKTWIHWKKKIVILRYH